MLTFVEPHTYRIRDKQFSAICDHVLEIADFFGLVFAAALIDVTRAERQLDAYFACDDVYVLGFLVGFCETVERFADSTTNEDRIVSAAKESFERNSGGIGDPDRWKPECDEFFACVGRLKAVYRALEDFCAEADLDVAHVLHFNGIAGIWITQSRRYLDSPTAPDKKTHQLYLQVLQQIWQGSVAAV